MAGIDTYTKLCLHGEGTDAATTFRDASSGHKTITAYGTAQIDTAQKKFGAGSILLDGNSDYLTLADSADWTPGSGAFTIDFWVRFNNLPAATVRQYFFHQYKDTDNQWHLSLANNSGSYYLRIFVYNSSSTAAVVYTSNPVSLVTNTWYHIAFVRNGNSWTSYLDGSDCGNAITDSDSISDYAGTVYIGSWGGSTSFVDGWIDEYRFSKGIARWTANFTPPTEAYTLDIDEVVDAVALHEEVAGDTPDTGVDANTVLLLHGEGADAATSFIDSGVGHKTITRGGHTQIDTAQKKLGAASILFDGTDDYLTVPDSTDWYFGTGDFTIDFWVRFAALPADGGYTFFLTQYVDDTHRTYFAIANTSGVYRISYYASDSVNTIAFTRYPTLAINTWYHLAVTRAGNSFKMFLDGQQISTEYLSSVAVPNLAADLSIMRYTGTFYTLNGWIDELRITKGIARWTASFTPPTAPYGADLSTPEALAITASIIPDPGLPTDADMTDGVGLSASLTTSEGVAYLLDIDEDIEFNDTLVQSATYFSNISETSLVDEATAGSGSFVKTVTDALTTSALVDGQYAVTMRADDQVFPYFSGESKKNQAFSADITFPLFSNESHRGSLATQNMSSFDISAHMFITSPCSSDLTMPKFTGKSVMLTGRVFAGDTTFPKMVGDATSKQHLKFACNSNMTKPKCYATMTVGGRFTDYVLRYVR